MEQRKETVLFVLLAVLAFSAGQITQGWAAEPAPAMDPDEARCRCHTFKATAPGETPQCVPTYRCNLYTAMSKDTELALRAAGIKPYPRATGGWRVPSRTAEEQATLELIAPGGNLVDTSPTAAELEAINDAGATTLPELEAVLTANREAEDAGILATTTRALRRIASAKDRAHRR